MRVLLKNLKSLPLHGFNIIQSVALLVSLSLTGASLAQPDPPQLPRQIAWTAYNLGTTGYNQAVAIGAMLRDK